jgi:hypothetical protein
VRALATEHLLGKPPSSFVVVFDPGYTLPVGHVCCIRVVRRGQGQCRDRGSVLGEIRVVAAAVAEVGQA